MESTPLFISGNSFGLKLVVFDPRRKLRTLLNDNIRHGIQSTDPALSREPLAYFHRSGPVGDVFAACPGPDAKARVAIIGLGVGAMACYAEPGQHFTFYEIDPAVAQIASDPQYFTFLAHCRGTYEIVLGDGRERLAEAPSRHYDLIILDAFTSDVIPTHLVSAEALELYLSKLADGGTLVFDISNVHTDFESVLGKLAAQAGLACLSRADLDVSDQQRSTGKLPSHYLAMGRSPQDLRKLADKPGWKTV